MWCGVVWCGVVWCGVVWCGVVWCGVVWCGVVCFLSGFESVCKYAGKKCDFVQRISPMNCYYASVL